MTGTVTGTFDIQVESESDPEWIELEAFRMEVGQDGLRSTDLGTSYAFLRIPNHDPDYCENIFIDTDDSLAYRELPERVRIAFDKVVELATVAQSR